MSNITEEEIQKILPEKGPSFEEVKNYLEKYNDEYIVIKCGGSVLVNQDLFDNFINDFQLFFVATLNQGVEVLQSLDVFVVADQSQDQRSVRWR